MKTLIIAKSILIGLCFLIAAYFFTLEKTGVAWIFIIIGFCCGTLTEKDE